MSILSGEEPLIDRLIRAYNRASTPIPGLEAATGGGPLPGIPTPTTSGTPLGSPAAPSIAPPPPRIGIQTSIGDTPPVPTSFGPAPTPAGSPDIPPPTNPTPLMDKPTYEYAGNGMPFTNPTTVGPDPREDLSSEAGLAWLAKVRPNMLNTPAGPAMATIDTLRGGQPGLAAFYSPEQGAAQRASGVNLVGSPFEWNAGNAGQLNAALALRAKAISDAEYLRQKGQADVAIANAAETGKLAMYDPQRMETERLLEAGKQNPLLWQNPEFKQKVGVPLTGPEKLSMTQAAHPGLDVAAGLEMMKRGYAPGTSLLGRMFDNSRFSLPTMTPGEKITKALATIPSNQAEEWRRVAEVMGLLNPVTGQKAR